MKVLKSLALAVALSSLVTVVNAAEEKKGDKPKPYTLKTCMVSGEKLGEMGKPYVFTNDNREIKLCCKDCLKDYKKDPKKYTKKIEDAEAKEKKK